MMQLKEQQFYTYFEAVSTIPRGSGNEKAISDYVVSFAADHQLEVYQDELWNVIIYKPASAGYEESEAVILQCHMDMVCEKNEESTHNFLKDSIELIEEDGFLRADGTTLGCDNGMGMAYILAVLDDSEIKHPAIEAVFTTNEEVGLEGMAGLRTESLTASRMLNLDAEEEGIFITSCAGGMRMHLEIPVQFEKVNASMQPYDIRIHGCMGGHSGLDIEKGRANAIVLLGRILNDVVRNHAVRIEELHGGGKTNAIAREAGARIWVPKGETEFITTCVKRWQEVFRREYAGNDPGITVVWSAISEDSGQVLTKPAVSQILTAIMLMPQGVLSYSPHIAYLPDCSNSIGVLNMSEEQVEIVTMIRANCNSKMDEVIARVHLLAEMSGADCSGRNRYGAWEFQPDSGLQHMCGSVYRRLYQKEPQYAAIHAGLECAQMAEKRPEMDMISLGANLYDAHTPDERAEIASLIRVWEFLKELLAEMKKS